MCQIGIIQKTIFVLKDKLRPQYFLLCCEKGKYLHCFDVGIVEDVSILCSL